MTSITPEQRRVLDAHAAALNLLKERLPESKSRGIVTDKWASSTGPGGDVYSRKMLKKHAKRFCKTSCCAENPLSKHDCSDCSLYEFMQYLKKEELSI